MMKKTIVLLLIVCLLQACSAVAKDTTGAVTSGNSPAAVSDSAAAAKPSAGPKEGQPAAGKSTDEPKNFLKWDDFFDDDKQDRPSKKFSDQNGSPVTIDGFMGEILSMGKGWFLLIPRPGAECPFDNGDQSYWNSIMIVFVKDKDKLRYTQGALRLTGKLDVGTKKDESGYTTMFRLYDAEYTKK